MEPLRLCSTPARASCAAIVALACACAVGAQELPPEHPSQWTDKRPVEIRHFMVAAMNPLAVRVAE